MPAASNGIVAVIVLIEAVYVLRFAGRLGTFDPGWQRRFMAGFSARRRRRNRLIWASAAILLVGWFGQHLVVGSDAVDLRALAAVYLVLLLAVSIGWGISGYAEHRWFRRDGAPRSFLALHAAATAVYPIGLVALAALRLWR